MCSALRGSYGQILLLIYTRTVNLIHDTLHGIMRKVLWLDSGVVHE